MTVVPEHIPEALRVAFGGLPRIVVWEVVKEP
jgi:hypothetical protein